MAEPLKISTSKFVRAGKVDVDGDIWDIVLPGTGTELRFSQASRACRSAQARLELLNSKIDAGTATEEDLDTYDFQSERYEKNERIIYDVFLAVFKDGTKDNSKVKKWLDETPTDFVMRAFNDIRTQAHGEGS